MGTTDIDTEAIVRDLGERLRIARKRRRWSHKDLAQRAGVSRQTLQRMEAGDPQAAIGKWIAVSQVLGLPIDAWNRLADPADDALGLSLELQRAPHARRGRDPRDAEDFTIL